MYNNMHEYKMMVINFKWECIFIHENNIMDWRLTNFELPNTCGRIFLAGLILFLSNKM